MKTAVIATVLVVLAPQALAQGAASASSFGPTMAPTPSTAPRVHALPNQPRRAQAQPNRPTTSGLAQIDIEKGPRKTKGKRTR
jgi:hypothetical protein